MADIPGATSSTYVLTSADVGFTIDCRVTATNSAGPSAPATSVQTKTITNPVTIPVNTTKPSISLQSIVGQVITITSTGVWTNNPGFTYQWIHANTGTNIVGATANSYTLVAADVGNTVAVVVTGTNSAGSSTATSNIVGPITQTTATLIWDASNAAGTQVTYNPGVPQTTGSTNQYAVLTPWKGVLGAIEHGLGVAGSNTPVNNGAGADPRVSVVAAPGGRAGFAWRLRDYDGDTGAGGSVPGNLNPPGGSHFGSVSGIDSIPLINLSTNANGYIAWSQWLPGPKHAAGENAFPLFSGNGFNCQLFEMYGSPYTGAAIVKMEVQSTDGKTNQFVWQARLSNFPYYWKSPSIQYDCWNDFVIHYVYSQTAGWPNAGYVELWFGPNGGTTFGTTLVQQTFTSGIGGTAANGGLALAMQTDQPAVQGGGTNTLNFAMYFRPVGSFLSASPLTNYLWRPRLGAAFSDVGPGT